MKDLLKVFVVFNSVIAFIFGGPILFSGLNGALEGYQRWLTGSFCTFSGLIVLVALLIITAKVHFKRKEAKGNEKTA